LGFAGTLHSDSGKRKTELPRVSLALTQSLGSFWEPYSLLSLYLPCFLFLPACRARPSLLRKIKRARRRKHLRPSHQQNNRDEKIPFIPKWFLFSYKQGSEKYKKDDDGRGESQFCERWTSLLISNWDFEYGWEIKLCGERSA